MSRFLLACLDTDGDAAIDVETVAGNVVGGRVQGQETRHPSHLLGLSKSFQRDTIGNLLEVVVVKRRGCIMEVYLICFTSPAIVRRQHRGESRRQSKHLGEEYVLISDSMNPGQIALTVTPRVANSLAFEYLLMVNLSESIYNKMELNRVKYPASQTYVIPSTPPLAAA